MPRSRRAPSSAAISSPQASGGGGGGDTERSPPSLRAPRPVFRCGLGSRRRRRRRFSPARPGPRGPSHGRGDSGAPPSCNGGAGGRRGKESRKGRQDIPGPEREEEAGGGSVSRFQAPPPAADSGSTHHTHQREGGGDGGRRGGGGTGGARARRRRARAPHSSALPPRPTPPPRRAAPRRASRSNPGGRLAGRGARASGRPAPLPLGSCSKPQTDARRAPGSAAAAGVRETPEKRILLPSLAAGGNPPPLTSADASGCEDLRAWGAGSPG